MKYKSIILLQRILMSFIILLFLILNSINCYSDDLSNPTNTDEPVLILNSYHPGYKFSDDELTGILDVLQSNNKNWGFYIEYLDTKRYPGANHFIDLVKIFRYKYSNIKFSTIMVLDDPALEFAVKYHNILFKNAPIVFCGINNYSPALLKGHTNVTGIAEALDSEGTIDLMLRLHPDTSNILVLHDYTVTGLAIRKEIEALGPHYSSKIQFQFLENQTFEQVLNKVETLPKNSLILFVGYTTDISNKYYSQAESTRLLYKHSPVPIYSVHEVRLGYGIVGGSLFGGIQHGKEAAKIAVRVLSGEMASKIPVVLKSSSVYMFDYTIMKRFGIPLSALPKNSKVINKPVSFLAVNKNIILISLGIISFMSIVIFILIINNIQRRRSEQALRESTYLIHKIIDSSTDFIFVKDIQLRTILSNESLSQVLGKKPSDLIGKTDIENGWNVEMVKGNPEKGIRGYEKDDLEALNGKTVHTTDETANINGELHYFDTIKLPIRDDDGKIIGLLGMSRDITELKKSEQKINSSLKEKEALLRELYHRTNNNMQVICAMLNLNSNYYHDDKIKSVFLEMENRIRSMALVHQKLYQSHNLSSISLNEYIIDLSNLLAKSYHILDNRITLTFDLENIKVLIDTAIPCGLILNELISNSLKHAFNEERNGEIKIRLNMDLENTIVLEVSDNGIGVPHGFDYRLNGKMGLQTIFTIGEQQLQGEVIFKSVNGFSCTVRFKDILYDSRV